MKKFPLSLYAFLGLIIAAQFFRPDRTNPKSDPAVSVSNYKGIPTEVVSKLKEVCFDCHSNETRWPWYSYVTPVNYFVASDVSEGRRHLNFSEWGNYSPGRIKSILDNVYDQVYSHEMPLTQYTWMHPHARLSEADVKMICDWASSEEDRLDQLSEMESERAHQQEAKYDSTRTKN
jgi:hypothetical protein